MKVGVRASSCSSTHFVYCSIANRYYLYNIDMKQNRQISERAKQSQNEEGQTNPRGAPNHPQKG